jgi:hypothetical protein
MKKRRILKVMYDETLPTIYKPEKRKKGEVQGKS